MSQARIAAAERPALGIGRRVSNDKPKGGKHEERTRSPDRAVPVRGLNLVRHGDCLSLMRDMDESSVDSIVTDPPYGLSFMGKEWDRGVPGGPFWTEALRVAKPGAYLLAMGGTRTWHRLACAIEDSGWQMRDTLCWLYGQGFPKGKACLKPAWEPIIMARKRGPMRHLRIDACRTNLQPRTTHSDGNRRTITYGATMREGMAIHEAWPGPPGRWPANVCLDEEAAAILDGEGSCRGTLRRPSRSRPCGALAKLGNAVDLESTEPSPHLAHFITSVVSRFFYCAKASRSEREAGLREAGLREAGTTHDGYGSIQRDFVPSAIRNRHPTVKPLALMRWLCRLVTPVGGIVLDPFAGSGSTGCAAVQEGLGFIGIEQQEEYVIIARARVDHWYRLTEPTLPLVESSCTNL